MNARRNTNTEAFLLRKLIADMQKAHVVVDSANVEDLLSERDVEAEGSKKKQE